MRLVSTVTRRAVAFLGHLFHFGDDVVDLAVAVRLHGAHFDRRIDEAGGADDLLGEDAAGAIELPRAGRGGDVHGLGTHAVPFLEFERAVVHARGQAEAVFAERGFAREVAAIHAADLRNGDVAFVGEDEGVVGEIFEHGRRRLAGFAAGEVAAVILDAGAGAGGEHHLHVEVDALLEALGFEQFAVLAEVGEAVREFVFDGADGLFERHARRDVVRVGVDFHGRHGRGLAAGEGIELVDALDFVAEEGEAPAAVFQVRGPEFDGVAADAEHAAREAGFVALVVRGDELADELLLRRTRRRCFTVKVIDGVGLDRADAVDAADRGDDDDVVAFEDRARCGVAHAVDLLVDVGFFLDVGVGARHVRFGLVIVVVADEILDRVLREELAELAVELRGERLVRREDERGALHLLDHLRHGEGLARAGDAEQDLVLLLAS